MRTTNLNENSELGGYIRRLRAARGYSLRSLAGAARVDPTWLSRLERGSYTSPDPRALSRLARALGADPSELYLAAGYRDGHGLPGFSPYLRAKYDLPDEAIAQLEAHFELLNEHYLRHREGGRDG